MTQQAALLVTRDEVIHMVKALDDLLRAVGAIANEHGSLPADGSQAKQELKSVPMPEMLEVAYAQAGLHIEAAGDHLMAFCKTVTEPVETIAPWTCVRGVLEASALAVWCLDLSLQPIDRIKRSFAFRYEGLRQQAAVIQCIGDKKAHSENLKRIDEVEADALQLGLQPIRNRKGERAGIGQVMPSIIELVKTVLDEEVLYRVLSGAAHAHPWALRHLSFEKVDNGLVPSPGVVTEYPSLRFLTKALDAEKIAFLCIKSARVFARPIWCQAQLFGWDTSRLARVLDTAFDSLRIRQPRLRFWRTPTANRPTK